VNGFLAVELRCLLLARAALEVFVAKVIGDADVHGELTGAFGYGKVPSTSRR
jgi:hypothetical protein